jgi:hypothetical protein
MTHPAGAHSNPGAPSPLFKDTDVYGRLILMTGIGLALTIVVFMLISHWLLRALVEAPPPPNVNSLAVRDALLPLDQRLLRISPPRLEGLRSASSAPSSSGLSTASYEPPKGQGLYSAERQRLNSYGWIDQKQGIIHIPIDRAMAIMAEKGMPYRKSGTSDGQGALGAKKPSTSEKKP